MAQTNQSVAPDDRFDPQALEATARQAVEDALLNHKRAGVPIVVWKDGKVVIVPADQIPITDRARGSMDSE